MAGSLSSVWGIPISHEIGALIFSLFGLTFYLGNSVVGRVNSWLFIAMCLTYVALVGVGISEVHPSYLLHRNWPTSFMAFPLLLTAFSFQTMVPSLGPYLHKHAVSLRKAIIWGTTLAFGVYIIWQIILLGIIPVEGEGGLIELLVKGVPATEFLSAHVNGSYLSFIAECFAFFALSTSFLGIGLGLYDFLSDGLKIEEKGWGAVFLSLLVIVPTYYCAVNYERVFLIALDLTGGVGDTILNGIIPCLLVWVGRYKMGYKGIQFLKGGKITLSLILALYVITLIYVFLMQIGATPSIFNVNESL
jgi:tyrosine-specific transport protein